MPDRWLPVRPDLDALVCEARAVLSAMQESRAETTLLDAQAVLAGQYQAASWERLTHAVRLADAIWRDDADAVRQLVSAHPALLHEPVLIRRDSNWGPPMSYAANLGRDALIRLLCALGATDFEKAIGRAALQGQVGTVRLLYDLAGQPPVATGSLAGPAYTLNVEGTAALLALGAPIVRDGQVDHTVMEHLLGTDSRNPEAKQQILALYEAHGLALPDTPVMALHRRRTDLLAAHLERDPALRTRSFSVSEIYALAPACQLDPYTMQGTPVHGGTLLHLAVHFDDEPLVQWLLAQGMDPDVRAAVDAHGFGGHTPLFATLVSQHNFWVNHGRGRPDDARLTRLLLEAGANPNARASLRARLEDGHGGGPAHDYRDVTPRAWGERYHAPIFVSRESLRLVAEAGGAY